MKIEYQKQAQGSFLILGGNGAGICIFPADAGRK